MAALFLLLGQKLVKSVAPSRRPAALAAGFAVLGGVSLLPFVGALVWSVASIVAVGVALVSRFGRPRYRVLSSGARRADRTGERCPASTRRHARPVDSLHPVAR